MFKSLFNEGYSKKFLDRIEFRRKEYYENRRIQTIRKNAGKMALNWTHEYPTGTPLSYIRDDIIESWERAAGVGIYAGLVNKKHTESHMEAVQTMDSMTIGSPGAQMTTIAPAEKPRGTRKDPMLNLARSQKKYVHSWRNPPDEDIKEEVAAEYKVKGPDEI